MMEEKTANKHVQSPLFVRILHGTHIDLMRGTIILLVCMKITGILRGREQIPFLSASMNYTITLNLWKSLRRNLRKKSKSRQGYKLKKRMKRTTNICTRQLREDYMKKLAGMRAAHWKQWEEFLQRQPQTRQTVYRQLSLAEYDQSSRNLQYIGPSLPMDSASRYQYPADNYSSPKPHEGYGEFQCQRHEDLGNTYDRY